MTNTEMDKVADLINHWRHDLVAFVREMFGAEPSPQQIPVLRAMARPGAKVACPSGHGTGKSTMMAWKGIHELICYSDVKVVCTAPTAHQLEDVLWNEVKKWQPKMLEPWRSALHINSGKIFIDGLPNIMVARTGRKENPEALQGFHADHLLFLIDEASGIPDQVFEVAQGALTTPVSRVVMMTNPTRASGYFFRACHKNRDSWEVHRLNSEESPLVTEDYIKNMKRDYGEDSDVYRVRVLGKFPQGGDLQFIPTSLAEAAALRHLRPDEYESAPVCLGVDVAAFGGDRSVIFLRQGLKSELLWQQRNVETCTLAGVVARLEDEHHADAVFVDANGVGFGLASNLRQMGRAPIAVQLGGGSSHPAYLNKRAECWGNLRDWLKQGGAIPPEETLIDDLCAPEYGYNLSGKLQLERKESMRARGLPSPDLADALALTFAAPVVKSDGPVASQADDRYDLFKL